MIGRPFEPSGINFIDVDNISAAVQATNHLISLGYKRIATITGAHGSAVTVDRITGYRKAIESAGRSVDESLIVEGDFTESGGYAAMKSLLPLKPDAVFAGSDVMAAGAIRAAQEEGLRIPNDLAVVGFDDIPLSTLPNIQLTTIRQPIMRLGIKAVELLIDVIENGAVPARRIILDTELVVRESCGARLKEKSVIRE
jgi:DNA-binding LacI/PurR family transcriptional regulator